MIGILDSGEGGMNAARYLQGKTKESIIFFPDRKNAPYGTKTKEELIALTSDGINHLLTLGARRVLIACCTAGTVYPYLEKSLRDISFPLLAPTAREAVKETESGRIALIATEATVNSRAFEREILRAKSDKRCEILSIKAQQLVKIVEDCASGEKINSGKIRIISNILAPLKNFNADTLILGCTHFPSLENIITPIAKRLGVKRIVSSVKAGADAFLRDSESEEKNERKIYLSLRG